MRRKIFLIISAGIILLTAVSLIVLYNLGDRIINELLRAEFESAENALPNEEIKTQTSSNEAIKPGEPQKTEVVPTQALGSNIGESSKNDTASGDTENKGDSGDSSKADTIKQEVKPTPKPIDTTPIANKPTPTPKPNRQITPEKIEEIKEMVTFSDKISAAVLVLKRLSADDIAVLEKLMVGGVSKEEKKEAKNILYERFTDKEIEQIKEMYDKYMDAVAK